MPQRERAWSWCSRSCCRAAAMTFCLPETMTDHPHSHRTRVPFDVREAEIVGVDLLSDRGRSLAPVRNVALGCCRYGIPANLRLHLTTPAPTNSAEPPPAPANHKLAPTSPVRKFDEGGWGISLSASKVMTQRPNEDPQPDQIPARRQSPPTVIVQWPVGPKRRLASPVLRVQNRVLVCDYRVGVDQSAGGRLFDVRCGEG